MNVCDSDGSMSVFKIFGSSVSIRQRTHGTSVTVGVYDSAVS